MIYKGSPIVLTGLSQERSPFGAYNATYDFEGLSPQVADLANNQPLGIEVKTRQAGATASAHLTYSPDTFTDKWEVDRENIDKDLMFNIAFNGLSVTAKLEIKRWRADPTGTNLFMTDGEVPPLLPTDPTPPAPLATGDGAIMQDVHDLVLRGTEAYQVSTLVLKRTRVASVNLASTLILTEQTQVFTTDAISKYFGLSLSPNGVAVYRTLPGTTVFGGSAQPYPPPNNTAWSWLPRNSNRSYVSRGIFEEHSDWVFAAWSLRLYSLISH